MPATSGIEVTFLKISQIHLHDEIERVRTALDLPPLRMPLSMGMAKRAKEEVTAVLSLSPPLVTLQNKKWHCIGNVRAFLLARELAHDESEAILCLSTREPRKERIAEDYLRELFWQPALLGLRRRDITLLAAIAQKAIDRRLLVPPGEHHDGVSFIAALHGLDKRTLQKALATRPPKRDAEPDASPSSLDLP